MKRMVTVQVAPHDGYKWYLSSYVFTIHIEDMFIPPPATSTNTSTRVISSHCKNYIIKKQLRWNTSAVVLFFSFWFNYYNPSMQYLHRSFYTNRSQMGHKDRKWCKYIMRPQFAQSVERCWIGSVWIVTTSPIITSNASSNFTIEFYKKKSWRDKKCKLYGTISREMTVDVCSKEVIYYVCIQLK